MSAHVEVWRTRYQYRPPGQQEWSVSCLDYECPAYWDFDVLRPTHAEALAAALQHCRDYPRGEK